VDRPLRRPPEPGAGTGAPAGAASAAALDRLDRLAWLLDSSVRIPGTQVRMGVDSLIGLVPGVGDLAGALLSSWILLQAARLGAPRRLLARMGANVALETLVGAVPLAGDLFDVAFEANRRNVSLLRAALAPPGPRPA